MLSNKTRTVQVSETFSLSLLHSQSICLHYGADALQRYSTSCENRQPLWFCHGPEFATDYAKGAGPQTAHTQSKNLEPGTRILVN